jgi:hypothetical protein
MMYVCMCACVYVIYLTSEEYSKAIDIMVEHKVCVYVCMVYI